MELGIVAQFASVVVAVTALVVSVVGARSKAVKDAIDAVRSLVATKADKDDAIDLFTRMLKVEHDVSQIKTEMEHLPDAQTTHRLEKTMVELQGQLAVMGEKLKPVAAIGDRLQDFLLQQVKNR